MIDFMRFPEENSRDLSRPFSGARVLLGEINGRPYILKIGLPGSKLGLRELIGITRLGEHLRVNKAMVYDPKQPDKIILEYLAGPTLHQLAFQGNLAEADLIRFVQEQSKLWKATLVERPITGSGLVQVGYQKKIAETIPFILGTHFVDIKGIKIKLEWLKDYGIINDGELLMSLNNALTSITEVIGSDDLSCLVHGDENLTNVKFERKRFFYFDLSTVSNRSPYEALCKVLYWLEINGVNIPESSLEIDSDLGLSKIDVNFQYQKGVAESILKIKQELNFWLTDPEQIKKALAYSSLYFLREFIWTEKRGHQKNHKLYLLKRALEFASAIKSGKLPFPFNNEVK